MKRYWYFIMWLWNKIPFANLFKGASLALLYITMMVGWVGGMVEPERRAVLWTIGGVSTFVFLFWLIIWPDIRKLWEKFNEESEQIFDTLRK